MDELYFRAFVDQGSWGDYEAAFELFEGRAAESAGSDAEVLTLGCTANEDFEALDEANGTLTISVLTDADDAPVSAVAQVRVPGDRGGPGRRPVDPGRERGLVLPATGGRGLARSSRTRSIAKTSRPPRASPSGSPS